MRKVITYGTYDLLHYGHVKLLQRAKALGHGSAAYGFGTADYAYGLICDG